MSKKIRVSFYVMVSLLFASFIFTGCGGGNSTNTVINGQVPLSGSNTVIADSIKVERSGETVSISYQTSTPVKKASIVTSSFAFNNAPLWSEFNEVKTEDGLRHSCSFKAEDNKHFMIYAGAQDKFDNGGKGIEIK